MARCVRCENVYDKSFDIVASGKRHVFDSFECAIQALAPTSTHCRCRILGHGLESNGHFSCCARGAEEAGATSLKDRS